MALWFFVLGLPLAAWGLVSLAAAPRAAQALTAFPRSRRAGRVLCAVAWLWTAHACDVIGIEVFDRFLKAFPGELWILAAVLTVLTCRWMENLLPVRGASALLMLFPGELFPAIRLCDTPWRLALVVFAYVCAAAGMFGMFYPWRVRQALAWLAARPAGVRAVGGALGALGALFVALGACAAGGLLK